MKAYTRTVWRAKHGVAAETRDESALTDAELRSAGQVRTPAPT
jgi:hypothetical protein